MNKKKKAAGKVAGALIVTLLVSGAGFTASASGASDSGNVWIDVIRDPSQARLSVTVPLSYGFAVIGSVDEGDDGPVSADNGNLLVSNVRVEVDMASPSNAPLGNVDYQVQVLSKAELPIMNYSTDIGGEHERDGLPISVSAYMVDSGGAASPGWELKAGKPTDDASDFKRYRLLLDGKPFEVESVDEDSNEKRFALERVIEIPAPANVGGVDGNGYLTSGRAIIPSETPLSVTVEVGGKQNQYQEVEQSVKVGEIRWRIEPMK